MAQAAVVLVSGSVALLGDTIHNLADAEAALAEPSTLDTSLDRCHLYHATLAALLRELERRILDV